MSYDVLHSISRWTKTRLHRLGATVSDTEIIATEEQAWKGLSPSQRRLLELRGNLLVDTGGGGGGPEWLPEGALYFADFIGVHYWNGAECAVTDLFEQDGAFGGFNPATDIGVSGLLSGSPCFKSAISSALIDAGFTAVCAFRNIRLTDAFGIEVFDSPNYNTDWSAYVHSTGHGAPSFVDVDTAPVEVAERQPDGATKAAFVFTTTVVKLCQAGGTVYATDPSEHSTLATSVGIANATLSAGLASIAIYAGNLSDGQLQALTV